MLLTGQKYHRGDLVKIAKNLGPMMSHFEKNCYAIVVGSYNDVCQSNAYKDGWTKYCLLLHPENPDRSNRVSWYEEDQLELLETSNGVTLGTLAAYENKYANGG